MSFRQILDRISRIARAEMGHRSSDSFERELRRAQALIDEARRREHGDSSANGKESGRRGAAASSGEFDEEYLAACRVLGVAPGSSWEEISAAFRARAREIHPDRVASLSDTAQRRAHHQMQQLNAAYEYLERRSRR